MNNVKSFGLDLSGITDSVKSASSCLYRKADFIIVDCTSLSEAIQMITSVKRHGVKLSASISPSRKYNFNGREKTASEAFAILYDLVDAFVVYNYNELDEDVDPLIESRRFCEQYRPIYIHIPENLSSEETDEVIAYSLLSNVDALMISNFAQLDHCIKKASGALEFIFCGTPDEYGKLSCGNAVLKDENVSCLAVKPRSKRCHFKALRTLKRLASSILKP